MAKGRVQVDLEFVLVEKLVVPWRMTSGTAALHTSKILRPPRSSSVFFQPLLLRSPDNEFNGLSKNWMGKN